jgi:hypothetical protein
MYLFSPIRSEHVLNLPLLLLLLLLLLRPNVTTSNGMQVIICVVIIAVSSTHFPQGAITFLKAKTVGKESDVGSKTQTACNSKINNLNKFYFLKWKEYIIYTILLSKLAS